MIILVCILIFAFTVIWRWYNVPITLSIDNVSQYSYIHDGELCKIAKYHMQRACVFVLLHDAIMFIILYEAYKNEPPDGGLGVLLLICCIFVAICMVTHKQYVNTHGNDFYFKPAKVMLGLYTKQLYLWSAITGFVCLVWLYAFICKSEGGLKWLM